ncbi:hypothetical protein FA95DRAFT_857757 [Auriscalpium vulgare]|uniref:Uncharacterized protein n=1 Tax=Auriscalpium vulgare TaxID=40419 RepID=A0ACB8S0V7_9AGAM|nr:hypothetical protein FA95DRAFT_857757 [Auriscalpium vulgare]
MIPVGLQLFAFPLSSSPSIFSGPLLKIWNRLCRLIRASWAYLRSYPRTHVSSTAISPPKVPRTFVSASNAYTRNGAAADPYSSSQDVTAESTHTFEPAHDLSIYLPEGYEQEERPRSPSPPLSPHAASSITMPVSPHLPSVSEEKPFVHIVPIYPQKVERYKRDINVWVKSNVAGLDLVTDIGPSGVKYRQSMTASGLLSRRSNGNTLMIVLKTAGRVDITRKVLCTIPSLTGSCACPPMPISPIVRSARRSTV